MIVEPRIGLYPAHVRTCLREGAPGGPAAKSWGYGTAPPGSPAFYAAVRQGLMLAPEGTALGFERLGYDGLASFHSWLCNSLVEVVSADVHVRPNEFGLLGTLGEAEQPELASISRAGVGKEPGVWLPWLVKRYPQLIRSSWAGCLASLRGDRRDRLCQTGAGRTASICARARSSEGSVWLLE